MSLNPGSSNSRTSGVVEGDGKKKKDSKAKLDPIRQEDDEDDDPSEGDREGDDEEEREGLVKALRRMGIRAPKPFDPKRERKTKKI